MLRSCVMDFGGTWDKYLSLKNAYNNSFQESIQMAPLEASYGRQCQSLIGWFEANEAKILGPDLVKSPIEKVQLIRKRLLAAQSRQKGYADKIHRELEFLVGDHVFLRVSSMKGVLNWEQRKSESKIYWAILNTC